MVRELVYMRTFMINLPKICYYQTYNEALSKGHNLKTLLNIYFYKESIQCLVFADVSFRLQSCNARVPHLTNNISIVEDNFIHSNIISYNIL